MKRTSMFLVALILISCIVHANPNQKVLAAFERTFKDVREVSWCDQGEQYCVQFTQNAIRTRLVYDEAGNIVHALRYYTEENLPLLVLSKVKAEYKYKKIFGVTEECNGEQTVYHIVLEDEKHWYHISTDSEGMSHLDEKLIKA
jgi:hypothetical protein